MIKKEILATLAYYDVFDFPLKEEEIWAWQARISNAKYQMPNISEKNQSSSGRDFKGALAELVLEKKIFFNDGFYYLFERDYLVPLRLKKEKNAKKKWRRVRYAERWLRFLPFVRAIFASGSLAINNTDELSDLDVLVVAKHRRIWLTRLLVSGSLSLLGMRRKYNQKIAPDKICLNHYITDKSLYVPFKSIYNAQTYLNLKPIFIRDAKIFKDFYSANDWLGDFVVNFDPGKHPSSLAYNDTGSRPFSGAIYLAFEFILGGWLGDWLESLARRWQTARIEKHRKQDPPGGRVVYNDNCLEFHPGSAEEEIIKKFEEKTERLFSS